MENAAFRIIANEVAIAAGRIGQLAIRLAFTSIITDDVSSLTENHKKKLREIAERIRDVSGTLYGICYDLHTV